MAVRLAAAMTISVMANPYEDEPPIIGLGAASANRATPDGRCGRRFPV
jgi:hypothetical protein